MTDEVPMRHRRPLLPQAPDRLVFDRFTPEAEAAHCHLAALLIHAGDPLGVTRVIDLQIVHPVGVDVPSEHHWVSRTAGRQELH